MNIPLALRSERDFFPVAASAGLMLASGGDARIFADPQSGRNRYGTTATPRPEEIFLSSSTASTITPRGYRAAQSAWINLTAGRAPEPLAVEAWFEKIRARLLALFGIEGASVILAGSGTEAELIAVAIAKSLFDGPLTNIVLAPAETGSGVMRAAGGKRFLDAAPFGEAGRAGDRLEDWESADIDVGLVEIRDALGNLRAAANIDAEARRLSCEALAAGRNVLLHRLDSSKTGCAGLTVGAAAQILADAPERVAILVDCCQLRCSRERIQSFLQLGFMVTITGSKFFSGPPFSGALLLPPRILRDLEALALPSGLGDYASRLDWPAALRTKTQLRWRSDANLGLGLRWTAALEEMKRFFALPDDLRENVLAHFVREIRERAKSLDGLAELAAECDWTDIGARGVLSFTMKHEDGAPFSAAETASIHARLRSSCPAQFPGERRFEKIFHLGQPVAIGPRSALRVCVSAAMISETAERISRGESLSVAFADWSRDFDALFGKWRRLMEDADLQRSQSACRPEA
jgi:hypothetical protein